MNLCTRHRLLAELMRSPLSAWREFEQDEAGTTFEFRLNHPIYGYIGVRCEDSENGEEAGLFVNIKRVGGASDLYSYLVGKWSWSQKRALRRKLRDPNREWQCHSSDTDHEACLATVLNGDAISLYEHGNLCVERRQISDSESQLYREIMAECTMRDWESEMLGPCPPGKTCG